VMVLNLTSCVNTCTDANVLKMSMVKVVIKVCVVDLVTLASLAEVTSGTNKHRSLLILSLYQFLSASV